MKIKKYLCLGFAGLLSLTSCNDFLDKLPDNRIDPQNPEQLQLLLTSGYMGYDYATMCELSSDNMIDNHALDDKGINYPRTQTNDPINDQYFAWEDANMSSRQDSPTAIWTGCYHAIAVANHALEKIAEFRADGKFSDGEEKAKMDAAYGEALLIRAYHHFLLVNFFSKQYGITSDADQGIPYSTEPEDKVHVDYDRGTVAQVYQKIEEDLTEGLKFINDGYYQQLRYHFNSAAANAFAARFYLMKRDYDKVENYATAALGANPASKLRSDYWNTSFTSLDADGAFYFSSARAGNFLLLPTNSVVFYNLCFDPNGSGGRYALSRDGAVSTLYGNGPVWNGFLPCMAPHLYVNGGQEYGLWPSWMYQMFEFTDKVAGIGYPKRMRAELTAEETLLARAEARIFKGDIPGAVSDLDVWLQSHNLSSGQDQIPHLTKGIISAYYNKDAEIKGDKDPRPYNLQTLNIEQVCTPVNSAYALTEAKLPFLWCTLHFRRIETVMTGYRWFDIKRFGIEITHKIGRSRVETLTVNDERRAFQIPIESIQAGLTPTLRTVKATTESQMVKYKFIKQ